VARIFISHSSHNNERAIQVRDWLRANGGEDVFLNDDPERGIAAGERWKEALPKATRHCEAILALLSPEWLAIPSREVGVLVHDVHRERE
jgi:TIR domain